MPRACQVVQLQTHKAGNLPQECEDRARCDPAAGLFALSDGAGEGIFSREWASLLVDSFIQDRPDLTDAEQVSRWLAQCRRAWRQQINLPQLGWAHRSRVEDQGAGATFLTLQVTEQMQFHAQAVGDSCLFWVRDGCCRAAFPITASGDFPVQPDLFSSHDGAPTPPIRQWRGECAEGDLFVLATDAVARWLHRRQECAEPIDWRQFGLLSEQEWAQTIEERRRRNPNNPHSPIGIDNDDSTLLLITVAGPAEMV